MSEKRSIVVAAAKPPLPTSISFLTGGLGGIMGWLVVHPFNTCAIRMNLASSSGVANKLSFLPFAAKIVKEEGFLSLYNGLPAGIVRQVFYATSRLGLFEVMRDFLAKYRENDIFSRLAVGVVSGGMAAVISCPAEVSLVRMSNDMALAADKRRNYTSVVNAAVRIAREEGIATFWRGCMPFVNRAALVGACQVGTYDQFRIEFKKLGVTAELSNVFAASMASGLLYSLITMPFETAKNRMAFQRPDPVTKLLPYKSTIQTILSVAKADGALSLWSGFMPYYLRCGGHTVVMFISVEWLRGIYFATLVKK